MAEPRLVPVDHDPFADVPQDTGSGPLVVTVAPNRREPKLVPVDHDPFAQAAPANEPTSRLSSAWQGAIQGITGNFGDEIAGGINAGIDYLTGQAPEGIGAAYERRRDDARRQIEEAQRANPGTFLAGQIGGSLVPGVAATKLVTAPALGARMLQGAGVGAALGGIAGAGEGTDAESRRDAAIQGAKLGGAFGAGGEALASGAGAAVRSFLGARGKPNPQAISEAAEFGIPLSRGQASGDITQQAFEEAARNNARGIPATRQMQAFDARQAEAIANAQQGISRGLGGQPMPAPAMGEAVSGAVRNQAQGLKQASTAAYNSAAAKNATIGLDEVKNLAGRVASDLEAAGIVVNPNYGTYGGTTNAMNILRRVSGFEGAPDGAVAQSLSGLDQARKSLSQVRPTNAEDMRALVTIRKSFDKWLDDAIDQKLFSGDATAIDDLKKGRELWSQYKGLTKAKPGDDASALIVKMQRDGITGEEVANWLLGTAGAQQAGRSARVASELRRILKPNSPEWEALRQAAWTKAIEPARGTGNQAMANSIVDFTNRQGAPLAKVLFTPQEIGQMQRLAYVMRRTVPDPKATNPSKSGYEVARMLGSNAGLGIAGTAAGVATAWQTGDPKYLALAALPLLRNVGSLSKGAAATKAVPGPVSRAISGTAGALTRGGGMAAGGVLPSLIGGPSQR
ncbi:hypothetical protein [Bosea sp. (in: a-proteobacteria)]|uniref:hypothetical protein n=1 Tax=Bosea sp. (in: a-proteobacteria) TaxID=1871050 RepID=UPI0026111A45|nr:hypothetical protein [Bosea sp. (in: a-proteobacteria)]MCO5092667.1 hypothetical protein [Bosea sp. (in: a-proteobacteria)]